MNIRLKRYLSVCLFMVFMLCGCGKGGDSAEVKATVENAAPQNPLSQYSQDSIKFSNEHHFNIGYNFLVKVDSLCLIKQDPEEYVAGFEVDTVALPEHERVVVSDIRYVTNDQQDSVWIELVGKDDVIGWIHEKQMLDEVVPDDPISEFIDFFSNVHLVAFISFIVLVLSIYIIVKMGKKKVPMVHFNDIDSFYPTFFCLTFAASATFYGSIHLFALETWREYYFHPTLNPFNLQPLLCIFIFSVWAIVITGIAAVDDARRHLPMADAAMYIFGMVAVAAFNYIVFTITTMFYIGYLLFAVYVVFAIYRFVRHGYTPYLCGNCGRQLHRKGRCPYCGMLNE